MVTTHLRSLYFKFHIKFHRTGKISSFSRLNHSCFLEHYCFFLQPKHSLLVAPHHIKGELGWKKMLPLSPSVFVGASPRAGDLFPAHHSHLRRVFWLKTHYASWSWYLSSVLESSLLLFLKFDCPLFSFASSSEDYYRSLRLFYSECHVTLSSACLSVLHSGLTPPMNFSAHRFSLRPCLSKALICRLRVLKTFVLISRSFLFFSNIPDLLEYCFFLMFPVYLLILVFNPFKHIYGL